MDRLQEIATVIATALMGLFGLLVQEITYLAVPFPEPIPQTDILFIGDMMFDRSVRQTMDAKGVDFIFSCITTHLAESDFVVGNLEGPITQNPSKSLGSAVGSPDNFVFTFPEYVAPLLSRHNIRAVSLGNNHISNFGSRGVEETTRALKAARVGYFGEPGEQSVLEIESKGILLTFIGYNEFDTEWTASTTINQIVAARAKGRLPVVFSHWGDEYKPASARQKSLAHRFVDAGAELVMGAHPHVIQESENYKGKYIYYSLGNFVFDQYWNEAVRTGLMVDVVFESNGVVGVRERNVTLGRDRRTCLNAE